MRLAGRHALVLALFFGSCMETRGQWFNVTDGELAKRGKILEDGTFLPGTTGAEWTPPVSKDLTRVNNAQKNNEIVDWATTSWAEVDCCKKLDDQQIWEHRSTGVPDCFCRDVLELTQYKTVGFCALEQLCENALKDWNKVFGEGYMVPGKAPEWSTESPARSCMREEGGRWVTSPCGIQNPDQFADPWVDPYGRVAPVQGYLAPPEYGTVITPEDLGSATHWRWLPGDVPQSKKTWHGFGAADGKIQAGLLDGSRMYPGLNHSSCCSDNITNDCCRNAPFMQWTKPVDAPQADCMFAVKRAICAYHFWECDASYHNKIYNGVCKHACDDVPARSRTKAGAGRTTAGGADMNGGRLGNFYHLGCTEKSREFLKDCTAGAARSTPATLFHVLGTVLWVLGVRWLVP